jgi:hypothetical protein
VRRFDAALFFVSFFGDGTAAAKNRKTKAASKRRIPKRGDLPPTILHSR